MKQTLPNNIPPIVWATVCFLLAVLFIYAASLAWSDEANSPSIRLSAGIIGLLCLVAARRSAGSWTRICEISALVLDWLSEKRRGEWLTVVLIIWGISAFVYPIFDNARNEAGERTAPQRAQNNLKQCGLALLMYTQDYDGTFPPEMQASTTPDYLLPYLKSNVFTDHTSGKPFTWRQHLGGKSIADFKRPSEQVVAYSVASFSWRNKQTRAVLFMDGQAKLLLEDEFYKAINIKSTPK